jgi:hypothetical protein
MVESTPKAMYWMLEDAQVYNNVRARFEIFQHPVKAMYFGIGQPFAKYDATAAAAPTIPDPADSTHEVWNYCPEIREDLMQELTKQERDLMQKTVLLQHHTTEDGIGKDAHSRTRM